MKPPGQLRMSLASSDAGQKGLKRHGRSWRGEGRGEVTQSSNMVVGYVSRLAWLRALCVKGESLVKKN